MKNASCFGSRLSVLFLGRLCRSSFLAMCVCHVCPFSSPSLFISLLAMCVCHVLVIIVCHLCSIFWSGLKVVFVGHLCWSFLLIAKFASGCYRVVAVCIATFISTPYLVLLSRTVTMATEIKNESRAHEYFISQLWILLM